MNTNDKERKKYMFVWICIVRLKIKKRNTVQIKKKKLTYLTPINKNNILLLSWLQLSVCYFEVVGNSSWSHYDRDILKQIAF